MLRRGFPAALSALLLALACAGTQETPALDGEAQPPQVEEIAELASLPPPTEPLPRGVAVVDRWNLRGALPEHPDPSAIALDAPWEEPLRDFAAQRAGAVVATESLRCLARELAFFHLEQRANPDDAWMTFVQSRCLTTTTYPRVHLLEGQVPATAADDALLGAWRSDLDQLLARELAAGTWSTGLGFARAGERAVLVLVSAREQVRLDHFDATYPANGRISVIGEALGAVDQVSAVVGIGELDAAPCLPHPGARPPAFHFVCAGNPGDPWNFVSIMLRRPGQVLTQAGALLVVRSPGEPAAGFQRRFFTSPYEPGPREALDQVVASELNRVRARVGLAPLERAAAQGEVATRLAPHYLAAVQGRAAPDGRAAAQVLELVVLGMVAGWDVEGVVAGGSFSSARAPGTRDVSRLLAAALQHPSDRLTLLDPAATQLAVGAVADPGGGLGAVFASYSLFSEESYHEAAGALLGRLIAQRAARGLPPPGELRGVDTLAMEAARRVQAGEDRDEVLNELLAASSQKLMVGVSGFGGAASGLDEITFPEELLTDANLGVALGLAAYRPPGAARGQWIVFMVTAPIGSWH